MDEKNRHEKLQENINNKLTLDKLIAMRDSCIKNFIETNNEIYSLSREIEEREEKCSELLDKIGKLQQSKNIILRMFNKSMMRKYQELYDASFEIKQYKRNRQNDLKILLKKFEEQRNSYSESIKRIKAMKKASTNAPENVESKQMGE